MKITDKITLSRLKVAIKNKNKDKITKIIENDKFNEEILEDELIIQIIETGYSPNERLPKKIKTNPKYFGLMTKKHSTANLIDYFDEKALSNETIDDAIKEGYYLTDKSNKVISKNKEHVTKIISTIIERDAQYSSGLIDYSELISTFKFCDQSIKQEILVEFYKKNSEFVHKSVSNNQKFFKEFFQELSIESLKEVLEYSSNSGMFSKEKINYEITEIIDEIDEKKLTEEVINLAIDNGYLVSKKTPKIIKKNIGLISKLAKNDSYSNRLILEFLDISGMSEIEIDDLFIKTIDDSLNEDQLWNVLDAPFDLVKKCSESNFGLINWQKYLTWIKEKYIKFHFMKKDRSAADYNIDFNKEVSNQYQFVLRLIKKIDNPKILLSVIELCDEKLKTNEFWNTIKKREKLEFQGMPEFILKDGEYLREVITSSNNLEKIKSAIDNFDSTLLTDELINLAIDKGYYVDFRTPSIITTNYNYIKKIITLTNEKDEDKLNDKSKLNSIINICDISLIDTKLLKLAASKGFNFFKTRYYDGNCYQTISKDRLSLYISLLNSDSDMVNAMLEYHYKETLLRWEFIKDCFICLDKTYYDKLFLNIRKRKIHLNADNYELCSFIDEEGGEYLQGYFNKLDEKYKEKIKLTVEMVGSKFAVYSEMSDLFRKEMFDVFSVNELSKIYKYLFLINKRMNFSSIIEEEQLSKFREGYNVIYGDFDVESFYDYYQKYLIHKNLIDNFDFSNASNERIMLLKKAFFLKYSDIELNEDNLDKLDKIVYKRNKEHMSDMASVKNTISLLLFNNEYNEVYDFCNFFLSHDRALLLAHYIENDDIKFILKKYAVLLKFFEEKIRENYDYDSLKKMATKLNELFLVDKELFNDVYEMFNSMKENILTFYGVEVNDRLNNPNIDKQKDSVTYNVDNYIANNDELGICNNSVDYVEYYDETYFLQHTMNAYGKGAKITDWKNPRMVGKTYICLSLVSDNANGVIREPIDVNHVTLLFNSFTPKNLKIFGNRDLATYSSDNSTNVKQTYKTKSYPTKIIIDNTGTNKYNEYNILRENEDGSTIYPCGVKVVGEIPTQSEIDAAAYLGVPLIKLHKTKDKDKEDVEKIIQNVQNFKFGSPQKNNELENLEKYFENLSLDENKHSR